MRIVLNIIGGLGFGLLAACTSEEACTTDLYARKHADLVAGLTSFTPGDPAKRDAVIEGLQDFLDQREAAGADDLSGACTAIDTLLAKLAP